MRTPFSAVISVLTITGLSSAALAQTALPKADKPGSADSPLVRRYEGSLIVAYERRNFDQFNLPLSKLELVPKKFDSHHVQVFEPKTSLALEGRYTRIVYLLPPERSALEVVRNYQDDIKSKGGKVLYECREAECGGDPRGGIFGNSVPMSLAKYLYFQDRFTEPVRSPGWCAMWVAPADQRYTAMELPRGAGYVSVLAYGSIVPGGPHCWEYKTSTFAVVDIIEAKPREQKMVTVKAADMAESISSGGKVALYGIHFAFNKADIQPPSEETLEQIGKLLKDKPTLKLLVVGHTDNVGTLSSNTDLSQRRAAAVVSTLEARFGVKKDRLTPLGVSFAAPVASNKTEEGRAKNRRVELVEN